MSGSYFYVFPSGLFDYELSDGARVTYAVILSLSNRYGYCFATNKILADLRNTSESSIKRHVKELSDKNVIIAEYNYRNDRRMFPKVTPQNPKNRPNTRDIRYIEPEMDEALDNLFKKIKTF